jgi:uncharacterized protein YukE
MDIKVDYDKINNIGSDVVRNDEELTSMFSDLLTIIDNLKECWEGVDYENFKTTSVSFLEEQRPLLNQIEFMGKYMIHASNVYSKFDENWGESMRRMGEEYQYGKDNNN